MRCEQEIAVGAYVLEALEPDEQLRMREHLRDCAVCRESVRELQDLPRVLAGVAPPVDIPAVPVPSELAFQRLRRSAAAVPRGRPAPRRNRWLLAAVAAAVIVGGGVAVGVVATSSSQSTTTVTASAGQVSARADISTAGSGSNIALSLDGLPAGARCELVVVGRDGREESAGNWAVTYGGTYHWSGWVGIAPAEMDRLVVRTSDGRNLVTLSA